MTPGQQVSVTMCVVSYLQIDHL